MLLGMERKEGNEWGEWEGVGKRGVNGNFYNLIKLLSKKKGVEHIHIRVLLSGKKQ